MDLKRIAGNISSSINRAVQIAEERLGSAKSTHYDAEFQELIGLTDATERSTAVLIRCVEEVLEPNPANRLEDAVVNRLERRLRDRKSPLYELGRALAESANNLGPGSQYSTALAMVSNAEFSLDQLQFDYILAANDALLSPMRQYLAVDCKRLHNLRSQLETKRLDLDIARARAGCNHPDPAIADTAEISADVAVARRQFEIQLLATRDQLDTMKATQKILTNCLINFVDAQAEYHSDCTHCLQQVKSQIGD